MDLLSLLLILFFWGIIWGSACSWLAWQKGRDDNAWLVLGFFFSIFAFVFLAAAPTKQIRPS